MWQFALLFDIDTYQNKRRFPRKAVPFPLPASSIEYILGSPKEEGEPFLMQILIRIYAVFHKDNAFLLLVCYIFYMLLNRKQKGNRHF